MNREIALVILGLGLALAGCPSAVVPTPATDASSPCLAACAALASVGCPIGSDAGCAVFMQTVNDAKSVPTSAGFPFTCAAVASISSKADAQKLGFSCQ